MRVAEQHSRCINNRSHPRSCTLECRQRDKDLEEARSRATQLEKTMRWWSDCTASWREKWATLRDERNYLREKLNSTQKALEGATETIEFLKSEKQELLNDFRKASNSHHNSTSTILPLNPAFHTVQESSQSRKADISTNQDTEKLNESSECVDRATEFPNNNQSSKRQLLELASTIRWWKCQCMSLEQEIRHLFDSNTKNWSKCEVLSHENYLLKQENDLLKKEIASLWSIRDNVNDTHADRISSINDLESRASENIENDPHKQNTDTNEMSVEDLLFQLSEKNCQIDLLQRRLSFMLHERGVLCHQLEEMNTIHDKLGNKMSLTAKSKRTQLLMNNATLKDDFSKYSYRTEIDSNCDTEFTSELPTTSLITTTNIVNKAEIIQSTSSTEECKFLDKKASELQIDDTDGI
uniref:Coiled-coil domain-containing protein 102A n=1 Tax=Trichobilharzia regenti TaxID=157069 RepID=A0AA85JHD1_TRIRE|nr:unnamed protein product [Trichobilharzia regenti]